MYIQGSDLLIFVSGKAIGHCTSCTINHQSDTTERVVKPLANIPSTTAGKWTEKSVSKLSVSLSAEGFSFESETENGYKELRSIWELGEPILCKYCTRGQDGTTYYSGQFIITSLSETSPAGQDATYNISLENSGAVTEYP